MPGGTPDRAAAGDQGVPQPFSTDIDWRHAARPHQPGGGQVRLHPGAGGELIRMTPLIRPLVELHWVRMDATLNRITPVEEDLRRHLFRRRAIDVSGHFSMKWGG